MLWISKKIIIIELRTFHGEESAFQVRLLQVGCYIVCKYLSREKPYVKERLDKNVPQFKHNFYPIRPHLCLYFNLTGMENVRIQRNDPKIMDSTPISAVMYYFCATPCHWVLPSLDRCWNYSLTDLNFGGLCIIFKCHPTYRTLKDTRARLHPFLYTYSIFVSKFLNLIFLLNWYQ